MTKLAADTALTFPLGGDLPLSVSAARVENAIADVMLQWQDGVADNVVANDDILADPGLETAALLSLFVDRRADDDDDIPSGDGDRRGWWADQFLPNGDKTGSRLWLLDRASMRADLVKNADSFIREGLAWMIEDKVTERVDVEVETAPGGKLFMQVTVARPAGDPVVFRFAHVWDGEASR